MSVHLVRGQSVNLTTMAICWALTAPLRTDGRPVTNVSGNDLRACSRHSGGMHRA